MSNCMSSIVRLTVASTSGLLKQSPCSAARALTTSVKQQTLTPPSEPAGLCCGQGCTNCVWLVYANELIDYYRGQRFEDTVREIEKKVTDVNVRAYVLSEVRLKWRKAH